MRLPWNDSPVRLGTIFRQRWGSGVACFGMLIGTTATLTERGRRVVGTIDSIVRTGDGWGKELARVDLLNLKDAAWAPVFTSRIRTRRSSR